MSYPTTTTEGQVIRFFEVPNIIANLRMELPTGVIEVSGGKTAYYKIYRDNKNPGSRGTPAQVSERIARKIQELATSDEFFQQYGSAVLPSDFVRQTQQHIQRVLITHPQKVRYASTYRGESKKNFEELSINIGHGVNFRAMTVDRPGEVTFNPKEIRGVVLDRTNPEGDAVLHVLIQSHTLPLGDYCSSDTLLDDLQQKIRNTLAWWDGRYEIQLDPSYFQGFLTKGLSRLAENRN